MLYVEIYFLLGFMYFARIVSLAVSQESELNLLLRPITILWTVSVWPVAAIYEIMVNWERRL